MTTAERAEARADLVAYIKAIPCARPEDAIRIEKKHGLAGYDRPAVIAALQAAAEGINPLDAIATYLEGND